MQARKSDTNDAFRNVHISRHCINGEQIAYAHVQFLHESDAERATDALDGHAMSRGPIRIDWAKASMPSGKSDPRRLC